MDLYTTTEDKALEKMQQAKKLLEEASRDLFYYRHKYSIELDNIAQDLDYLIDECNTIK